VFLSILVWRTDAAPHMPPVAFIYSEKGTHTELSHNKSVQNLDVDSDLYTFGRCCTVDRSAFVTG
jgi:hypothetical protein